MSGARIWVIPWPSWPKKPAISSITSPWVMLHNRPAIAELPVVADAARRDHPAHHLPQRFERHRPLGTIGGFACDGEVGRDSRFSDSGDEVPNIIW